ncbi:transposase [Methanobrevibacter sp.]|uniref:transposase n=1 Tax=Methanobrevibacter sp. TaxID=66852 RepID=UPI0038902E27
MVDLVDCSKANPEFHGIPGEFAYPRKLLLRPILMSVFDEGLSSREIERKIHTNIAYMYLAAMKKPLYRTIARFKVEYSDLIDEAFKTTIKIAKEICCQNKNYRIIQDYRNPSKIRMQRKMETDWAQKIYKKLSKTAELSFAQIQNMNLHEFRTIRIINTNTEFNYMHRIEPKKNIQRNKTKKIIKIKKPR